MSVYEYSPFFNENRVLEIKIREASKWIDGFHLCEADRTFSYAPKSTNFNPFYRRDLASESMGEKVHHHPLKTEGLFRAPPAEQIYYDPARGPDDFDVWYWRLLCGNAAYFNEAVQRNRATHLLENTVHDDDIVILSDLDEVLDGRYADQIVEETRKRGIITVKLHYSVFYLNLFTASNHGTPHFSYRLYVMTGRYFKTMPFTPDYLRKRGIEGGFLNEIHCLQEFMGFHHSWLEHDKTAFPKLKAFEANVQDRSIIDPGYAEKCLRDRRLHYLKADLYIDNEKKFLGSLKEMDTSGLWLEQDPR